MAPLLNDRDFVRPIRRRQEQDSGSRRSAAAMDAVAKGLTPHLLRQLKFGPSEDARSYNAISTDLQAVNSR
jgi:hypothetical protein